MCRNPTYSHKTDLVILVSRPLNCYCALNRGRKCTDQQPVSFPQTSPRSQIHSCISYLFLNSLERPCNTTYLQFPVEMTMREIRSESRLILAYLTLLNSLADLGKMIKWQKNSCSDCDLKKH